MQNSPDIPTALDADLLSWDEESPDNEHLSYDEWEARRDERTRVILKLLENA